MALTIKGIKITNFSTNINDNGKENITCNYQLVASNDRILAKESVASAPSYGEPTFVPSGKVQMALKSAIQAYKDEIEISLGFKDPEPGAEPIKINPAPEVKVDTPF